jgi:hypothetical protein
MPDKTNILLSNHAKDIAIRYNNWFIKNIFDASVVSLGNDDEMFQRFLDDEKKLEKEAKESKPYFISKNSK